jgi:hypothetical protein
MGNELMDFRFGRGSSSEAQNGWLSGRHKGAKIFIAHHGDPVEL